MQDANQDEKLEKENVVPPKKCGMAISAGDTMECRVWPMFPRLT
jgi:hypothetical protein